MIITDKSMRELAQRRKDAHAVVMEWMKIHAIFTCEKCKLSYHVDFDDYNMYGDTDDPYLYIRCPRTRACGHTTKIYDDAKTLLPYWEDARQQQNLIEEHKGMIYAWVALAIFLLIMFSFGGMMFWSYS